MPPAPTACKGASQLPRSWWRCRLVCVGTLARPLGLTCVPVGRRAANPSLFFLIDRFPGARSEGNWAPFGARSAEHRAHEGLCLGSRVESPVLGGGERETRHLGRQVGASFPHWSMLTGAGPLDP